VALMSDDVPFALGDASLVRLEEIVMILELHRQGVSVSTIARRAELDRKTVRRYIAQGLEPPRTVHANRGYRNCRPSSPVCASAWRRFRN
jgi:predicted DNA-binding transcriptional regulator YafY